MAIRSGEKVRLWDGAVPLSVRVAGNRDWVFTAFVSDAGRPFLEVHMNISAASWLRLVEMAPGFPIDDAESCEATAMQIAWDPHRDGVGDVPGALRMLPVGSRVDWG